MSKPKSTGKSSHRRSDLSISRRADGVESGISGATPYQPKMTRREAFVAVDKNLGERVRLSDYRPTITPITLEERELLMDQAKIMLEEVYVHLPFKRAMHGTEPIQRLRLLKLRHSRLEEWDFQSEMIDIFSDLRDLHTNYVLPSAYWSKFAFLPFRIEEFYDDKARKYIVSWVSPANTASKLKPGVIVTHWNGSPIDVAVARNADREAGSNPDARRARGVDALTLRWLGASLPPEENWVTLTYTDGTNTYESRFYWEVIDASDRAELLAGLKMGEGEEGVHWGIDWKTVLLERVRKELFDPQAKQVEREMARYRESVPEAATGFAQKPPASPLLADTSLFPDVFPRFGTVETPSGQFGYVRLKTFAPVSGDVDGAVREFARILSLLPPTGLILDVRGNGGGYIALGERILQMLTPRPIVPEPFHFVATPLTLAMAESNGSLERWKKAIAQGIETGASFSQGFELTPREACNDIGQVYQGPVVLIVDALCYSTTDIFAAGFQDHEIGTILGIHNNTGAGGANVWDHHEHLQRMEVKPHNPFVALPKGAAMRVAVRRSTRVGERSGAPLEDLGVAPDVPYFMTRSDVLKYNADLIAYAAQILALKKTQTLRLTASVGAPIRRLEVKTDNIDRVDVLVEGRPVLSLDVKAGVSNVNLPNPVAPGATVIGNGYRAGELVVSTRYRV